MAEVIKPSDIVEDVQGVVEQWLNALYLLDGQQFKVVHLSAPEGTDPGVMFLETRDRDLMGVPNQRFIVEITARPIP